MKRNIKCSFNFSSLFVIIFVSLLGCRKEELPEPIGSKSGGPKSIIATTNPFMLINDPHITEGQLGSVTIEIVVSLNLPRATGNVTVNFNVSDYTAVFGLDYTGPKNGSLTFLPGETSKKIQFTILSDTLTESTEYFKVQLSNVVNATLLDSSGLVGIIDEDSIPLTLSLNGPPQHLYEGNTGERREIIFILSLNKILDSNVVVRVRTLQTGTAIGGTEASAEVDFIHKDQVFTFFPGETRKEFRVTVIGDNMKENTETLYVQMSETKIKFDRTNTDGLRMVLIVNDDLSTSL